MLADPAKKDLPRFRVSGTLAAPTAKELYAQAKEQEHQSSIDEDDSDVGFGLTNLSDPKKRAESYAVHPSNTRASQVKMLDEIIIEDAEKEEPIEDFQQSKRSSINAGSLGPADGDVE